VLSEPKYDRVEAACGVKRAIARRHRTIAGPLHVGRDRSAAAASSPHLRTNVFAGMQVNVGSDHVSATARLVRPRPHAPQAHSGSGHDRSESVARDTSWQSR
jgi:hypothetical protein